MGVFDLTVSLKILRPRRTRERSVGLCVVGLSVRRSVQRIVEKRQIGSRCRLAS